MAEPQFCIGMRRGGVVWWDDGRQYVDLMKHNGPVLMIGLDAEGLPEYPNLARILKTATLAEFHGVSYKEQHDAMAERTPRLEGWWGRIASALLTLAGREHDAEGKGSA